MASRTVGLDLGTSSLKATQVRSPNSSSATVERVGHISIPHEAIQEGLVSPERADQVVVALKQLWKQSGFKTKSVVLGMNNSSSVFTRTVDLPWRSPEDLKASIRYEVARAKVFPSAPEDMELDYVVLGESGVAPKKVLRVMLVTIPRAKIEQNVRVVERAGLKVVGVDINALASLRALPTVQHEGMLVDVVVDVGAELLTLLIHLNGQPRYIHLSSEEGGNGVTQFIQHAMNLDTFEEAEHAKIAGTAHSEEVVNLLDRVNRRVAASVRNVITRYMERNSEIEGVGYVTLTGGGALLEGLATTMEHSLGVSIQAATHGSNPLGSAFAGLSPYTPDGHDMLVSAGLATGARF